MKKFILIGLSLITSCCSSLNPIAISSNELNLQSSLKFKSGTERLVSATKEAFSESKWLILYEGNKLPTENYSTPANVTHNPFSAPNSVNYAQIAFDKALSPNEAPKYYMQAKTPTSGFSYGAEIFVVIYSTKKNESMVSISASTGQALEKKKLEDYITNLTFMLNTKVD